MDIIISNSNSSPIYKQITSQIKQAIMENDLKSGDLLPSMRLLAKELRISVITTKRAYEELEREGFIETVTGKGSYVSGQNLEVIREEQQKQIEEHLQIIVDMAKNTGIPLTELTEMLHLIYQESQ